jgi:hypothetical protein
MISLAATSRWAIRPSGETFELVRPGMSRVVARILGVADPDIFELPRACLRRYQCPVSSTDDDGDLHLRTRRSARLRRVRQSLA